MSIDKTYTLMHISDLHAGPPFRPDVAAQVAQHAHDIQPDLLIISGDLVQRAIFPWQWHAIKAYLQTLPQPQLIVPGNHDVPLLDGFSRFFAPMRYYRHYITQDLNPVFQRPGLIVVGGSSAHGWTVDGGYVNPQQSAAMEQAFAAAEPDACKIAVMHHPIINAPTSRRRGRMRNATTVIEMLQRSGVEMFLCGHVHFSHIGTTPEADIPPGALAVEHQGIVICQSGTTTSRRGRGTDRGKNSFNVITVDNETIRIHPHFHMPDQQRFVPVAERVFARRRLHAQAQEATTSE